MLSVVIPAHDEEGHIEATVQGALEGLRRELESLVPRVQQVIRQTNARHSCREQHRQPVPAHDRSHP